MPDSCPNATPPLHIFLGFTFFADFSRSAVEVVVAAAMLPCPSTKLLTSRASHSSHIQHNRMPASVSRSSLRSTAPAQTRSRSAWWPCTCPCSARRRQTQPLVSIAAATSSKKSLKLHTSRAGHVQHNRMRGYRLRGYRLQTKIRKQVVEARHADTHTDTHTHKNTHIHTRRD